MTKARLIPFLAACAGLLVIIAAEWAIPQPRVTAPAPAPLHLAANGAPDEDKSTDDWAETINARPLFVASRRPAKNQGGGRLSSATGLPRLAGIMITPYGKRAIFMPDGGKPVVVKEHASLNNITIDRILSNCGSRDSGGREQVSPCIMLANSKTPIFPTLDKSATGTVTPSPPPFVPPNFPPGGPRRFPGPMAAQNGLPGPGPPFMTPPSPQADDTNDNDDNDSGPPQPNPNPNNLGVAPAGGMPAGAMRPHGREQ